MPLLARVSGPSPPCPRLSPPAPGPAPAGALPLYLHLAGKPGARALPQGLLSFPLHSLLVCFFFSYYFDFFFLILIKNKTTLQNLALKPKAEGGEGGHGGDGRPNQNDSFKCQISQKK